MNRDVWTTLSRSLGDGMGSLQWYHRTRAGAERLLLAPAVCIFVTLVFAFVWGELHLIVLALAFAGAFAVLAGQLTGELHEREVETVSAGAAKPDVAPLLARISERRSEDEPEPTDEDVSSSHEGLAVIEPASPKQAPDEAHEVSILARLGVKPEPEPVLPQSPPSPPADLVPQTDVQPVHEVREPGAGQLLHTCPTFLDACDFAFDFIEENDPAELEIIRVADDTHDTVWSYTRADAVANRETVDDTERFLTMIARSSWRGDGGRSTRQRPARRRRT